jgi:hypothetical protein
MLTLLRICVIDNEVRKTGLTWKRTRYLGPLVGAYASVTGPKQAAATGTEPRSTGAKLFSVPIGQCRLA